MIKKASWPGEAARCFICFFWLYTGTTSMHVKLYSTLNSICTGFDSRSIASTAQISWIGNYLPYTVNQRHLRILRACCARSAHSTQKPIASAIFSWKAMTHMKPESAHFTGLLGMQTVQDRFYKRSHPSSHKLCVVNKCIVDVMLFIIIVILFFFS